MVNPEMSKTGEKTKFYDVKSEICRGEQKLIQELQLHQIELQMQNEELRKTQEELQKSQDLYFDFYNLSPTGYFTFDEKGVILDLNMAGAAMLGMERRSLIKRIFRSYITPDSHPFFDAFCKNATGTGIKQLCEVRLITQIDVLLEGIAMPDAEHAKKIRIVMVDITERKQAGDALMESEERYRTAVEHSNDGVTIVCEDKHVFVNKRFLEMFGYERSEEIIGKTHSIVVHPDDYEMVMSFNKKRQRKEPVPSIYEIKCIRKTGEIIYIEVSATNINYYGKPASLVNLREITERKNREEELFESTDKIMQAKLEWEALVDSLHELVFLLDDKGCIIRANLTVTKWGLGQPTDMRGQKLHNILHPSCKQASCYLKNFVSGGMENSAAEQSTEMEAKDDVLKKYLYFIMRPIHSQKNMIKELRGSFAVVIIHDITERKQSKASLTKAYEELKETQQDLIRIEKLALLGKFSSGIAHEIRNPLANIRASAQFCLSKYELDEEIKKHLRIMVRNSENANKIIKDLIDLAKPSEVSLEMGNMADVIHRVYDLIKTRCEKQHVFLHEKISKRLPLILMDEERIEKAFLNFMLNALDSMPKGGKLSITAYPYFDKDEVIINILDTGKGITQENMEKIFHPFFSTKRTGIGLGLCLAEQVISSHRGKLVVNSKAGEGTEIVVKLPISLKDKVIQEAF